MNHVPEESYEPTVIVKFPRTLDDIIVDLTQSCEPQPTKERDHG